MPTPAPGTTGSGTPASPAPSSTPSSSWTSRACPTCSGRSSATTSSRAARRARPRGGDAAAAIELTLAEAAFGVTREVDVDVIAGCERCDATGAEPGTTAASSARRAAGRAASSTSRRRRSASSCRRRPAPACGGRGVRIDSPCTSAAGAAGWRSGGASRCRCPRGIASGQRLRLAGRGHDGEGGARGDLYVQRGGRVRTAGSSATGTTSSRCSTCRSRGRRSGATRRRRDARRARRSSR